MKRILTATALTFAVAAPAFAATEAERAQIETYLPNADISAWSDAEVATAMNVIRSNESRSEITGQLTALYGEGEVSGSAMLTEAEVAILDGYVDGVDYTMLPQARVDAALVAAQSQMNDGDKATRIEALLIEDDTPMSDANDATRGEAALINQYAPEVDVTTLSNEEVASALAIINSNEMRGDIEAKLSGLLM
ncbi:MULTISPECIES: hypothetical protein [unclassified Roseivivax]|uniref:hypothetical protein n=1 Tax=Roseivivax sp. GX 12232 TaxID=2900547 RepID=UPI001E2F23DA|nr:hypothetical protein [Roseivivax sp. GX 12232]MCE0504488.1 hypothetical protein [Roseivivax sp. GX 12232]